MRQTFLISIVMSKNTSIGSNFHPFHSSPLQVPWKLEAPWLFVWSFVSSHSSRWTRRPWCLSSPSPPSSQPMDRQIIILAVYKTLVWSDRNHICSFQHIMPQHHINMHSYMLLQTITGSPNMSGSWEVTKTELRRGTSWPKYLNIQPRSRSTWGVLVWWRCSKVATVVSCHAFETARGFWIQSLWDWFMCDLTSLWLSFHCRTLLIAFLHHGTKMKTKAKKTGGTITMPILHTCPPQTQKADLLKTCKIPESWRNLNTFDEYSTAKMALQLPLNQASNFFYV